MVSTPFVVANHVRDFFAAAEPSGLSWPATLCVVETITSDCRILATFVACHIA
ncbi:MAG: hypothetical protein ACI87E_005216 [Mariniblastus sp.]|jgi:hypothetical protein